MLQASDPSGTTSYFYGLGDSPLAGETGGAWRYLSGRDALNSVRQETDAAGQVLGVRRFDPYGVPITGDGGQPYGYSGEWWDAGTELVYLRARYLRPELGLFLTRDPWPGDVRQPGTLQGYGYGMGNPLKFTDPSGRICVPCIIFVLGGMALTVKVENFDYQFTQEDINSQKLGFGLMVGGGGGQTLASLFGPRALTAATTSAAAMCVDGDPTNEAGIIMADTNTVINKLADPRTSVITQKVVDEIEKLVAEGKLKGVPRVLDSFQKINVEGHPKFGAAQDFFRQVLPRVMKGFDADVYHLAAAAVQNGTLLTSDKRTIFNPLLQGIQNGRIQRTIESATRLVVTVPNVGQVIVDLAK